MDIKNIVLKVKNGEDLTEDEISFLDVTVSLFGMNEATLEKLTSSVIERTVLPLLEKSNNRLPQGGEPENVIKFPVNGYSSFIKELSRASKNKAFNLDIIKAMSTGSDEDGGYLVETVTSNEVLRFMDEYGILRKYANVITTNAHALKINTRNAGMTAYFHAEAVSPTQSGITYSQVTLTPARLSTLSDPISQELIEDSLVNMINEVGIEAMQAMAYKEDLVGFTGTGVVADGGFTGICNHASVQTVQFTGALSGLDFTAINNLLHKLPASRRIGAQFFANKEIASLVRGIKDNNDRPIFIESMSANVPSTLFGFPFIEADAMPDTTVTDGQGFLVFGNLRNCVRIYDRRELIVEVTGQGYVNSVDLFSTSQSVIKHSKREGILVARPTGLAMLVKNSV